MAGWFAKATQLLQGAPPEPQPFDLACGCGHRVPGIRQPSFQAVRCNRCGRHLFVLPADVYPQPKPKKKKKPPDAQSPLKETASLATAPTKSLPVGQVKPPGSPHGAKAAAVPGTATVHSKPAEVIAPTGVPLRVRRTVFSPFRLIVLAVVGVVALTGYLVWQSHLKAVAERSLSQYLTEGEAALHGGNVRDAAADYRKASDAVDRLRREDPDALTIRAKARELNAIINLSPISLYQICDEARKAAPDGPQKWSETFIQLYRDAWLVVEGKVVDEAGSDGASRPVIRYPFPIDEAPFVLDARLAALESLPDGGRSRKVIFAGQLAALTKEGTKNPTWVLRFKNASTFLWCNSDTYQALGPAPDALGSLEETNSILKQQAEAAGLKP